MCRGFLRGTIVLGFLLKTVFSGDDKETRVLRGLLDSLYVAAFFIGRWIIEKDVSRSRWELFCVC